ncbi:MAG: hypothetical protein JNK82_18410 [Myxococcaceae bacterium]|nr:hypothetical protein [Myxococcaceae bacterium]
MALLYSNAGKLAPTETQLDTIANVAALKGNVVNMVGGAGISVDPNDPAQQNLPANASDRQVFDAFVKARGTDVHANLIDKSGVLWPADFHSWAMVTTYWNFEQAFKYYQRVYDTDMVGLDLLQGAEVLYWADFRDYYQQDPTQQQSTDNALYYPLTRQFIIAPYFHFQKVPVSMNLGIVGHEMAHRVFTQKAYANAVLPPIFSLDGFVLNIAKGFDEGLADFHGYGVTCVTTGGPNCATNFIEASFDEETMRRVFPRSPLPTTRDFSRSQNGCMSKELRDSLVGLTTVSFTSQGFHYKLGTLVASALWHASEPLGQTEAVQKGLIAAYDDSDPANPGFRQVFDSAIAQPGNISLGKMADVIIGHMPEGTELQKRVCEQLVDRLDIDRNAMPNPVPHCPSTASVGDQCPAVPP